MSMKRTAAAATAGLLLLTGSVPAAAAQPSSSTPSTSTAARSNAVPPSLPPGTPPPKDTGKPDVKYVRTNKECVASDTKSELIQRKPWGQLSLNLDEAHRLATGKGVKIAIIDTGVDPRNPRFKDRVEPGGDYVDETKNGTDDCDGHGSEVAGVAAAKRTEGDFDGAAPDATILAIRQTSDRYEFKSNTEQRSSAGKVATLAQAIVRAADNGRQGRQHLVDELRHAEGFQRGRQSAAGRHQVRGRRQERRDRHRGGQPQHPGQRLSRAERQPGPEQRQGDLVTRVVLGGRAVGGVDQPVRRGLGLQHLGPVGQHRRARRGDHLRRPQG